ncbi:MAG: cytochrome c biogenesis protein ResB [Pyrinomonadaceae bacterium]
MEEIRTEAVVSLPRKKRRRESLPTRFLDLLCSVRLGIILLILLGAACLAGMLIMQQNVDGFERYYAELTPAQRLVYGNLGLFDIYHAWYFNALLAALSLNIILASLDRFPKTWRKAMNPKLTVPLRWLRTLDASHSFIWEGEKKEITQRIVRSYQKSGWRKTATGEKNGRTFVFAESGAWNRLGAYAVHIALLTIFLGGFLTAQFGHTGQMPLAPGQNSHQISELDFELDQMKQVNKILPFEVYCTDIQQKLIKKEGPLSAGNTIDWLTAIRIKDETGTREAVVSMNRPFDYRGYRFFQASFVSVGRARNITLRLKNEDGQTQDLTIGRDGSTVLADGTTVRFADFRGNFRTGAENTGEDTASYPNPGAILQVIPPGKEPQTAYAFPASVKDIPIAGKAVGGYTFQLIDFEKVSDQHILSVQRDPGSNVVYVGFALLFLTLVAVFFFSHRRVWSAIEEISPGRFAVTVGGEANRNQTAFAEKFELLVRNLQEDAKTQV